MSYLNYTKYIYLVVAIVLFADCAIKFNDGTDRFWLSFLLGCAAIITFFIRNKFAKKFDKRNQNQTPKQ